jgi:hypothetical protein
MSVVSATGMFSQVMYATQQASLLEEAFSRLVGIELGETQLDAQSMSDFAARVATSISRHADEFAAALHLPEKRNIEKIASHSGLKPRAAMVEYLANDYLFRAIRDYFELPRKKTFPQGDAGGFLAFTYNGSIVASPSASSRLRKIHYTRMPSRDASLESSIQYGALRGDIEIDRCLATTAFTTSAVRMLLYVPERQSHLFDSIQENTFAGVSMTSLITRGH